MATGTALGKDAINELATILTERFRAIMDEQRRHRPPQTRVSKKKLAFRARLERELDRQAIYDSQDRQDKAREYLPVEKLHAGARQTCEADSERDFQEELMKSMMKWFKNDFFKWVNSPECDYCLSATQAFGNAPPNAEELKWQADRVELYECTICGKLSRFPRYNNPLKLLSTQRGRCGEWANVFMLLCKTMGFECRYVLDFTDHVWVEWRHDRKNRWIHVDCCEGETAFDTPLMYEQGWGKKLGYIFAFGTYEVVDVIRRYTGNMIDVQTRRTEVSESWLSETLKDITSKRSERLPESIRQDLQKRREEEEFELAQPHIRALRPEELLGRQSGSVSWKLEREEVGSEIKSTSSKKKQKQKQKLDIPAQEVNGDNTGGSSSQGEDSQVATRSLLTSPLTPGTAAAIVFAKAKDKGKDKEDDLKGRLIARSPTKAISGLSVALAGSANIARINKPNSSPSSIKPLIQLTPSQPNGDSSGDSSSQGEDNQITTGSLLTSPLIPGTAAAKGKGRDNDDNSRKF
ncbi:hypothetical protein SeMB42_g04160 [Synchytrium endobioticum]|uniref:Transglutaminase-like domain-containing protein n=1 Tax=Synchytrium endobioticum TaxID=286115 RepID=A0A507DFS6_9FUNG|nr:hypothetical protein SeMB42_g04160 [Synchytrium endobioticum]TPX50414.1 hypothetical protein SeLEV6574_g00893 [Synchytrium endobioticum]